MTPDVVQAKAVSATHVEVRFSNGVTGVLDVSPYFSAPALAKLQNPVFFRRAHADHGTVVWDDDVDLSPESVWAKAVKSET